MPKDQNRRKLQQQAAAAPMTAVQPLFVQAPDFKTIYTNFVNSSFSPIDVMLMLGEVMGPAPDGKPVVLQRAKIIMTPTEAKIVSIILIDCIARYEKQFGKVVVSKDLMPVTMEGI